MKDWVKFSKCLMSPTCIPKEGEYSRLPPPPSVSDGDSGKNKKRLSRRRVWRKLVRRLVRESNKCFNGYYSMTSNSSASPLTFGYDALSYSHNFDDSSHLKDDDYPFFQPFSPLYPHAFPTT